jgi:hypothetical protein
MMKITFPLVEALAGRSENIIFRGTAPGCPHRVPQIGRAVVMSSIAFGSTVRRVRAAAQTPARLSRHFGTLVVSLNVACCDAGLVGEVASMNP